MEIKFMQTRITKLLKILVRIVIMGLVMTGIILINKKYVSNAEGSEKGCQRTLTERVVEPGF